MIKSKEIQFEFENESLKLLCCDNEMIHITQCIETGGGNCDVNHFSIKLEQIPYLIQGLEDVVIRQ